MFSQTVFVMVIARGKVCVCVCVCVCVRGNDKESGCVLRYIAHEREREVWELLYSSPTTTGGDSA